MCLFTERLWPALQATAHNIHPEVMNMSFTDEIRNTHICLRYLCSSSPLQHLMFPNTPLNPLYQYLLKTHH